MSNSKIAISFILIVIVFVSVCNFSYLKNKLYTDILFKTDTKLSDKENMKNIGSCTEGAFTVSFDDKDKTVLSFIDDDSKTILWQSDALFNISLVEKSLEYDNVLFNVYPVNSNGDITGSNVVFVYVKSTKVFCPYFGLNVPCSNAVILPTDDEKYDGLAWVLYGGHETESILIPINLRDGGQELGQSVIFEGQQLFECDKDKFVFVNLEAFDQDYEMLKLTRMLFENNTDNTVKIEEKTYAISVSKKIYWQQYK